MVSLIFIMVCNIAVAQEKVVFVQNIDSLIKRYISDHDLPSIAVGIVHEDIVLFAKSIQRENDPSNNKSKSIYNIASLAKPFVATAIMLLKQAGKIDITLPVVYYLPDFNIDSKYKNEITIEHLLTHTSGLPNTSAPNDYDYIKVDTTDSALANHIKSLSSIKLLFKPGKKYAYSNVGYEVLGQVVAEVSSMSFDDFMKNNLFDPLQMKRTSYILSVFSKSEIAQPHIGHPNKITNRFPYNRAFSPSGNLFTAIEDINKWMIFNLNNGQYGDFKPLSNVNFDMLTTPRVSTGEDDFMGLGWFVKNNVVFHDGLDLGYSALVILFTKQKIGITVLINHQEADCNEFVNLIVKAIKY